MMLGRSLPRAEWVRGSSWTLESD